MAPSTTSFSEAAQKFARIARGPKNDRIFQSIRASFVHAIRTFPWTLLICQFLWASLVTFVFHYASTDFSVVRFVRTYFVTPSGVVNALGWGLFVLLAFYVAVGGSRYATAATFVTTLKGVVLPLARCVRLAYRHNKWHQKDYSRLVAHLAAFPICVQMHLTGDRDSTKLSALLNDADINDIFEHSPIFMGSIYVVLAYLSNPSSSDENSDAQEEHSEDPPASALHSMQAQCAIDLVASIGPAITVTRFAPAKPYVATLVFLSILWFAFLPISLVHDSGG